MIEIGGAFALGFMSSLHCILMCGPLAVAVPVGKFQSDLRPWLRITFVVGRWFLYAIMGALVGTIGKPVSWLGFQDFWLWILAIGFFLLVALWEKDFLLSIRNEFQSISKNIMDQQPFFGFFILGMANGMLPCGMVYTALSLSVASGSSAMGALVMLFFGIANSWWHLILIFGWRIPTISFPGLSFLTSARVAAMVVTCALCFRIVHNLEHTNQDTHSNKIAPTESAVCRKSERN